jgi:hypothetical protein
MRANSAGWVSHIRETLHFEHLVCCFLDDERPRVRGFVYSTTTHQLNIWANPSLTLTGDQNLRALFRVASPTRGKPGHSQGCQKLFRETDLIRERATHLPIDMSIRITASLAPPGFPDHSKNTRMQYFSCSPWRGPLKAGNMSVRLLTTSRRSLTITTRIQLYLKQ